MSSSAMHQTNDPGLRPLLTAVHGGIGAGKSVVCRCFRAMGYKVFDCDSEAKALMDRSDSIKRLIGKLIDNRSIDPDGNIDRKRLSAVVFADKEKLDTLNRIVHESVRSEIARWAENNRGEQMLFVETAILYQSGIDRMADHVVEVTAPDEIRILRVMRRNAISRDEVVRRIESQKICVDNPHRSTFTIINDGDRAILPQIESFLYHI